MKLFRIGLLSTCIMLFAACGNYVEEYSLKSDGSGLYNVYSDVISGSADMGTALAIEFSDEDLTAGQIDSIKKVVTETIWEQYPGKTDSIVDLLAVLPDSFLDYKNNRKYAERLVVYLNGSKERGFVNMGAQVSFRNTEDFLEFSEFFERLQNVKISGSSGASLVGNFSETKSKTDYVLNEKSFGRSVTFSEVEMDDIEPTTGLMMEVLGKNGTYTTIVHTAKKIMSVTGENVVSQEDYKVVFEYPLSEYLAGELNTDFEIVFE